MSHPMNDRANSPKITAGRRPRPRALSLLAFPAGLLAACGAGEPSNIAVPGPPPVVVPAAPTAPPPPPVDDPNARLNALVCGRRDPCELMTEHAAGKDSAGRSLGAALFFLGYDTFGDEEEEGQKEGERPTRESGVSLSPDGATFSAGSYQGCLRYEYWRIVREAGEIVETDRVADICNDGHGAAGVGEDEVKVGPNAIEVSTSGGSNWRWSETTAYALSPFVRRSQSWSGFWTMGPNFENTEIDWEAFRGKKRWHSPPCDADGQPPEGEPADGTEYEEIWIPSLPLDAAFLAGGWKTSRLDRCAASIDASGGSGYILSGKPSTAADAHVRVLAAEGGVVFVEVVDDTVVAEDHLEVWVGPDGPSYGDHCIEVTSTKDVVSWKVRVTDGKVTSGFGKPPVSSLGVERAADGSGVVRLRLVPPRRESLTLVHADSDGGKKIERRIATSRLVDARLATLGNITPAADQAVCTLTAGALTPQIKPEKTTNP